MATLQSTTINDTGHLEIPSGTLLQRPGYVVQRFTTNGPGTFTVPTGVTAVDVLVVGAGGSGGGIGGGGGGGGVVYRPAQPVTPGGTVAYTIGTGGVGRGYYGDSTSGSPSTFGAITALGGGFGGSWNPGGTGGAGGNGGGGTSSGAGGAATQPGQPNPGGINYGFPGAGGGNLGGSINNATTGVGTHTGGGGGGAGAAGGHPSNIGPGDTRSNGNAGRKGGDGLVSSITGLNQYYAGGGGGGSHVSGYQSPVTTAGGGLGGGGRGASFDFHWDSQIGYDFPSTGGQPTTYNTRAASGIGSSYQPYGFGEPGQRNTGGGGGGGMHSGVGDDGNGGGGGPGVIIVRYLTPSTDAPEQGMLRYNTDSRLTEIYDGSIWKPVKRTVVEFNTVGAHFFKVPIGVTHCDVLVQAGGGAGGICGGGGGAGGQLYVPNHPISPDGTVSVYVGVGGGNQVETSSPPDFVSNKGQPSRFGGLEAYGGGVGAVHPGNGNNYPGYPTAGFDTHPGVSGGQASRGGSGGGAAYTHPGGWGRGIPGQGFPGGDTPGGPPHGCGGGGGAGGAGNVGGGNPAGAGGVGVANSITGTSITRGGGGGGGGHAPQSNGGAGGPGGGGGGGRYNNPVHASTYGFHQQAAGDYACPGQDNTGGGGGGSGHNSGTPYGVGGRGGPGVVIIRY